MRWSDYPEIDEVLSEDLSYISFRKKVCLWKVETGSDLYNYMKLWTGICYLDELATYDGDQCEHYYGLEYTDKETYSLPKVTVDNTFNKKDYSIVIGLEKDKEEIYRTFGGEKSKTKIIIIDTKKKVLTVNYEIEEYLPKCMFGYELVGMLPDPMLNGKKLYKRLLIRKRKVI